MESEARGLGFQSSKNGQEHKNRDAFNLQVHFNLYISRAGFASLLRLGCLDKVGSTITEGRMIRKSKLWGNAV